MFRSTLTLPKVKPHRCFGPIVAPKDPREGQQGSFHASQIAKELVRVGKQL